MSELKKEWYVVNTYAGQENRVKENLEDKKEIQTDSSNVENDKIEESVLKSENYFARRTINANESVNLLEQKNELIHRENKREVKYKYIGILFRTFITQQLQK